MTETEERHLDQLCEAIEKAGINDEWGKVDYTHLLKRIAIALEKIAFDKFPYSTALGRTYDPCDENELGERIRL